MPIVHGRQGNRRNLPPLGLVDDAQLRTARRLSEKCAEPPRLRCAGVASSDAVWQSRLSSCRAAISRNNEILGFSHFPFRVQRAEKFCSTPLNRRSAAYRRNARDGGICCSPKSDRQNDTMRQGPAAIKLSPRKRRARNHLRPLGKWQTRGQDHEPLFRLAHP